jgi:hypothetical protein
MILSLQRNFIDSVAQLVEQRPFKAWVLGSNPSRVTFHAIAAHMANVGNS